MQIHIEADMLSETRNYLREEANGLSKNISKYNSERKQLAPYIEGLLEDVRSNNLIVELQNRAKQTRLSTIKRLYLSLKNEVEILCSQALGSCNSNFENALVCYRKVVHLVKQLHQQVEDIQVPSLKLVAFCEELVVQTYMKLRSASAEVVKNDLNKLDWVNLTGVPKQVPQSLKEAIKKLLLLQFPYAIL